MSEQEYKSNAKELIRLLRTERRKLSPDTVERIQGWIASEDSLDEKEREFEALFEELVRYRALPTARAYRMNRKWREANGMTAAPARPLYRAAALRAAAVLVPIFAVGGWFLWNLPESPAATPAMISMNVSDAPDAHCRADLADGTDILIRPGTSISYAEDFGAGERRLVVLEKGEICLDVAGSAKPFVVETPRVDISVLGTRFDVEAEGERTVVTLYRGRVAIGGIGGKQGGEVTLSPGERFVCDNATGEYAIERTESLLPDWVARKLTFKAATHGEILKTVEWYYGTEVEVDGALSEEVRLDFRFTGREDIQTAMWLFQKVSREFTYEITPEKVKIKTKN